jgi:hypothetical protein
MNEQEARTRCAQLAAEQARPPADTSTDEILGGNLPPSAFGT